MKLFALSIAGPFGYWMVSQIDVQPYGVKEIELRQWTRIKLAPILVLIHVSSTKAYDHHFEAMPFGFDKAPKGSFVGAAVLKQIKQYDAQSWEADRHRHCWVGSETWEDIEWPYYMGTVYGHEFTDFLEFKEPILDVPGDRGYWRPNPKKPKQFERQQIGFNKAIQVIKSMRGIEA